jgi:pyrimidine-specific ribonucleoside hydrolase
VREEGVVETYRVLNGTIPAALDGTWYFSSEATHCDPGHDDALALILAFSSEKLDVKAVTVTGDNQTLAKTLWNAKRVLSFIGKRPPLGAGADKPMFRELETAPAVHGESGLDGTTLPDTNYREEPVPAVDLMRKTILESPDPVTLILTGPLTNVGILFTA